MPVFTPLRKVIIAALALCLPTANAYEVDTHDALIVRDVPVYQEAVELTRARIQAVEIGATHAFMQLASEVLTAEDYDRLPALNYPDIQPVIRGYQVRGEVTSNTSYRARVSYAFYKDQLESLLETHDIILAEYHQDPVLILPLFDLEGEYLLWQGENPWKDAWNQVADSHKQWFMRVPLGDVDDLAEASVSDVLSMDYTVLKTLQKRYEAGYLVIPEAKLTQDNLMVKVDILSEQNGNQYVAHYNVVSSTDLQQLLYRAALDAAKYLDTHRREYKQEPIWYNRVMRLYGSNHKVRVKMVGHFDGLRLIDEVTIQEVTASYVQVNCHHSDSPDTLRAYLENLGYEITPVGDVWEVREHGSQEGHNSYSPGFILEQPLPGSDRVSDSR